MNELEQRIATFVGKPAAIVFGIFAWALLILFFSWPKFLAVLIRLVGVSLC